MLKPQDMASVIITGPKSMQENVINELHALKALHITDHLKSELADIGEPLEKAASYSESLVKIRATISSLGIKEGAKKSTRNLGEINSAFGKITKEVAQIEEQIKQTDGEIAKNQALRQELEILKDIQIPLENLSDYKSVAHFEGFARSGKAIEDIKTDISRDTKNMLILQSQAGGKAFAVIFVDIKSKEQTASILQKHGFSFVNFSHIDGLKGTALSNLERLDNENLRLAKKNLALSKKLEGIKKEASEFLLGAEDFLAQELEKAEAPLRFAATNSSFLAKGWVPTENITRVVERLEKVGKKKLHVHIDNAKGDNVPVKLKNPKLVRPFQFFIDLYSYPLYREVDPTFFIFLSFPIFFGAMLGDVGYGLVSLALFLVLKWRMPKAREFFNILIISSISSIIFGFIFGEFFGYVFLHHPLVHRSPDNAMSMLIPLALIVGAIHVNIALIVGFYNENKSHGFMHAVYAKISWFILEAGAALFFLSLFKIISIHWIWGIIVCVLSLVMLYIGEGIKGPIEFLSIFTNMLSYARLMAIGLSSVILAEIVNESAKEMMHKGGIMIAAGILILVIGHVINLMLGLLGSFLHSLRLHYVEFFSKFFHGGAKKYSPFGLKE